MKLLLTLTSPILNAPPTFKALGNAKTVDNFSFLINTRDESTLNY